MGTMAAIIWEFRFCTISLTRVEREVHNNTFSRGQPTSLMDESIRSINTMHQGSSVVQVKANGELNMSGVVGYYGVLQSTPW